jgi:hypothetical protein
MEIFAGTSLPELFSFLFGIGLTGLYISGLLLFSKNRFTKQKLPQITFVKRQ